MSINSTPKGRADHHPEHRCLICGDINWRPGGLATAADHMYDLHGLPVGEVRYSHDASTAGVDVQLRAIGPEARYIVRAEFGGE